MSESVKKPKIGQRIMRAIFYGNIFGFIIFLITYFLITAINGVAGQDVIPAIPMSIGGYAIGFSTPLAIELSKDMEA